MKTPVMVATLLVCGCGGSVLGTWRQTSTVMLEQPSGPVPGEVAVDYQLLQTGAGPVWRVGGGCDAPLTINGSVAQVTTLGWTCPLQSTADLPFFYLGAWQWKSGDILVVKRARFELGADDRLSIDYLYELRGDPATDTSGAYWLAEFTPSAGKGAERLK